MAKKTVKIDFGEARLARLADKAYNEGKFIPALRFAYQELNKFGKNGEVFTRLADIYEAMGLHDSAIRCWYGYLDIATDDELPDIYEGLAVNYLNMGKEAQSAFYYNRLIDADATITEEMKMDIAEAFSTDRKKKFRFVYPPELADYSKELEAGSLALKAGNCDRAIEMFSTVVHGAKGYAQAKELQAVALLLKGEAKEGEQVCLELLKEEPQNVRVLATLAAIYMEQGRKEESKEIALSLCQLPCKDSEELYKVATVCCENGLHKQAFDRFCQLETKMSGDGRVLYFKGVSAYLCEDYEQAEKAFCDLCTIYPDAEVGKFYLRALRAREQESLPTPSYFYCLPQEEREMRCRALLQIGKMAKTEAELLFFVGNYEEYLRWCFDEMDGADHDLQYLALATAVHVGADAFLFEIMLNHEVFDPLKVETFRMLLERNEDLDFGVVLCHVYRKIRLFKITLGKKRRKRFLSAYAKIASRFVGLGEGYSKKIKWTTEKLYRSLLENEALDLVDNTDDLCCAIFLSTGFKELGTDKAQIANALDAKIEKVQEILNAAKGEKTYNKTEEKENKVE